MMKKGLAKEWTGRRADLKWVPERLNYGLDVRTVNGIQYKPSAADRQGICGHPHTTLVPTGSDSALHESILERG
jgi:hypothetical protein